jgi:hypothetical protein
MPGEVLIATRQSGEYQAEGQPRKEPGTLVPKLRFLFYDPRAARANASTSRMALVKQLRRVLGTWIPATSAVAASVEKSWESSTFGGR